MSLDAFGGVMVDAQGELTVQSLLELPGTAAHTELMAQAAFIQGPPTEITLDEDDVFQCGKCKKVFTSFQLFMFHKKEHQLSPGAKFLDGSMSLSLDGDLDGDLDGSGLVDQEICLQSQADGQLSSEQCGSQGMQQVSSDVLQYATLDDSAFDGLTSDISQPMMLEDSDTLNFSMEQSVLSITSANQLPEGTYISTSSMASLDSSTITKTMHEDTTSSTAWLLSNKDSDSNLNLVTSGFSDDRTLFLGSKRFLVDGTKELTPSLEFSNDDLLPDVSYSSSKEMFLNDSSINVSEVMCNDNDSRNMLQAGEYILKNGIDYINSSDLSLLTELENVRQQGMVNDQVGNSVSVSVLEVDIPNLTDSEISSSVMEAPGMEGTMIETSMIETSMIEAPIMGTPILETPMMEAPMMETTIMENSMIDSHMMENHIIDNDMMGNRLMDNNMMEGSMIENGMMEDVENGMMEDVENRMMEDVENRMMEDDLINGAMMEAPMMEPTIIESSIMETPLMDSPVLEASVIESPVIAPGSETSIIEAPVIEVEAPTIDAPSESSVEVSAQSDSEQPEKPVDAKEATWEPRPLKLECQFCEKKFAKQFDLRQHQRSHTGEKPFQCIVCGRAFAQKSNVKKHMETHKIWPKSVLTLPKNILQKVETKKKETETDSTKPTSSENVDDNDSMDLVSGDIEPSEEEVEYIIDNSYICQFCDASFESYFELKTHLKTHQNEKVYLCNQKGCKKTFPDLKSFVDHTQIHCSQEASYRCHVCKETFKTLADLGIHQYSHSSLDKASLKRSGARLICPECRSRFVTIEALENHMLMASHNHPCPECHRVFSCERNLRRHLNTHSTACPYVCKECGKGFKTETYLNVHLAMHSKDRPFACEHCTATFTRKDRLSRHLLIHQDGKRMKCPFSTHLNCTKEFTRKDKLKIHILSHMTRKGKSFCCQYCKKDFKKPSLLRKHESQCAKELQNENSPHRKVSKRKGPVRVQKNKSKTKSKSDNAHRSPEVSKKVICKLTPKARASRKKQSMPEISPESSQDERGSDNNNENVPTIEIIVMPLSLNMRPDAGENIISDKVKGVTGTDTGVYRVMFSGEGSEYPVNLTTGSETLLSRVDCDKEGGINLLSTDQEVAVYSAPADMQ